MTRGFVNTGTYKLYMAHCNSPEISEANLTLLAAQEMLYAMQQRADPNSTKKAQHVKILQKLTAIL